MDFELTAPYQPTGDQPEAIRQIVESIRSGNPATTLMGVTGSGKTFTMANVIAQLGRPTLILSHNKTLAAQLYSEFKNFFPKNLVECLFMSSLPEEEMLADPATHQRIAEKVVAGLEEYLQTVSEACGRTTSNSNKKGKK